MVMRKHWIQLIPLVYDELHRLTAQLRSLRGFSRREYRERVFIVVERQLVAAGGAGQEPVAHGARAHRAGTRALKQRSGRPSSFK